MGDFNEVLKEEEHSGYLDSPIISSGMRDFQDTARYCSLTDMKAHGPLFTWCNKRQEGLICKKLDRALVTDEWTNRYPQAYCVFGTGGCSDHLRGRIQITKALEKIRRPFKFTNALTCLPGFLPLMDSFWRDTEELYSCSQRNSKL